MAAATFDSREDLVRLQNGEPNGYHTTHGLELEADEISSASATVSVSSVTPRQKNAQRPAELPDDIPEEECWLFKPAKIPGQTSFLPNASCMEWAREVFDSPMSEFYHRRQDLLHRLEVILATEPAKRIAKLGGSTPALNSEHNMMAPSSLSRSKLIGGGSGQSFGPGSTATFTRPKRHASEVLPLHARQRSSPSGNRSPGGVVKPSGSSDDLQNVADLQSMARKQQDDLKAEVAAISAHQHAARTGGSQQSLNSANHSGPESPYSSQGRLNISSSPTPSDIAKQQMAALRLSLDSQRQGMNYRGNSDEDLVGGGEASIPYRPFPSPPPLPSMRYGAAQPQFAPPQAVEPFIPPEGQQAVIVGRSSKIGSRLPGPMIRKPYVDKGPRFPSNEALPSYGWGDNQVRRSSQEQLTNRRLPQPRFGHPGGAYQ